MVDVVEPLGGDDADLRLAASLMAPSLPRRCPRSGRRASICSSWTWRVCISLMIQNTRLREASQLAHISRDCLLAVTSRRDLTSSKVTRRSRQAISNVKSSPKTARKAALPSQRLRSSASSSALILPDTIGCGSAMPACGPARVWTGWGMGRAGGSASRFEAEATEPRTWCGVEGVSCGLLI